MSRLLGFSGWSVVLKILIFLAIQAAFMFLLCLCWGVYFRYKEGIRKPTGVHVLVPKVPVWKRLFWYFPRQMVLDYLSSDPEFFKYQGCIIYTGRQGSGKTVAMAEQTIRWIKEYPKAMTLTNFGFRDQDLELTDWRQLITFKNGIQGVIVCMDEMQNWFSSNQSKNFPPEMLQVITQNRKNRRVIQGTAQSFNRISKPIREQATEVRRCTTIFGCITFVHRVEPELDSEGQVEKWKHRGFYWFVHSQDLRESYDTWRVIEMLKDSGFQERQNWDSEIRKAGY